MLGLLSVERVGFVKCAGLGTVYRLSRFGNMHGNLIHDRVVLIKSDWCDLRYSVQPERMTIVLV